MHPVSYDMAIEEQDSGPVQTASQAINQVLEAEQVAEKGIAECKRAARKTIQNAQQHAALIAHRTNERITMQHLRCKQEITQQISTMERAAAGELRELQESKWDDQQLSRVVNEVAAVLTGGQAKEPDR
jgi:vacuolar-type H+-ATPase subunit H